MNENFLLNQVYNEIRYRCKTNNGRTGTNSVTMFLYFKEAGWSIKLAIRSTLNV